MSPDPIADMLVVLDDHPSSRAGLDFARRYATSPIALASWTCSTDDLDLPVQSSIASEPTVAEALRLAAQRGVGFVALRRDLADADRLLSDLLVAAAQNTDDAIPGFAILLASGEPRPVRRILAVADQRNSAGSGLSVLVAVSVARRTGATIDVLILGPNPSPDPAAPHSSLLAINREQELFDRALQLARDDGLSANWLTVEEPAHPWLVVADQLGQEPYDLVIDDLGEVHLGGRIGLDRSVAGILAPGSVGEMPVRLLTETATPLLLIIDEVRLGMSPARMFKVGAVAALALGVITPAAATTAAAVSVPASPDDDVEVLIRDLESALEDDSAAPDAPAEQPPTAEEERAADAEQSSRGGRDEEPPPEDGSAETDTQGAQHDEAARPPEEEAGGEETEEEAEAPEPPKGGAKPEDVADARSEAEEAQKDLKKDKKQKKDAEEEVEDAEDALHEAQERAQIALEDLRAAQLNYEAAQEQARQTRTTAVTGVLPGGPTVEDAHAATIMEQSARQALTAATIQGEAALHELANAQAEVEQASEEVEQRAADVSASKTEYEAAQSTVEVYEESLAETRQSPVEGGYDLTARYGASGGYWSGGVHTGLDFACSSGTDVHAAASGTVVEAGYSGAYGNRVVIEHEDGYTTTYNHLSDIDVSVGDEVSTGDQIGDVGSTGNVTGPHLHFEVLHNGEFVNPEAWLGW